MALEQFLLGFFKTFQQKDPHNPLVDMRSTLVVFKAIKLNLTYSDIVSDENNNDLLNNVTGIMYCDFDRNDTHFIAESKKTIENHNGLCKVFLNSKIYEPYEDIPEYVKNHNNEKNEIYGVFTDMMTAYNCFQEIVMVRNRI